MSWEGLVFDGVRHDPSPAETDRFGLTIGRVVVGESDPRATTALTAPGQDPGAELIRVLREAPEDLLVVRWPARRVLLGAAAARADRVIVPAGALTYWGVRADRPADPAPSTAAGISVTAVADLDDAERDAARGVVTAVVEATFTGYGNHYTANPLLDPERALAGYVDWALRSLDGGGRDVLVLGSGGEPVGVATIALDGAGRDLEILLAGLVPSAQGRGWYGTLLAAVGREAVDRGAERVIISTQAHNTGVQRAWARAGFEPFAAVETVHAVRPEVWRALSPDGD